MQPLRYFNGSILPPQNCNTRLYRWEALCVPHSIGHRILIVQHGLVRRAEHEVFLEVGSLRRDQKVPRSGDPEKLSVTCVGSISLELPLRVMA